MPTVENYAASIMEKYHVDAEPGSPPHRAADEITPLLKEWGKDYLLGLTLSGAYAKNTAVSLSSHVDILISLKPVPNMAMKNVFWNLFTHLTDHNLRPRTRWATIQVPCRGLMVDLIPACKDQNSTDVLFNKKTGGTIRTDIGRRGRAVRGRE